MYYTGVWQWRSGSDYLAHHGIMGQKWGKRNGPPYPLKPSMYSASEKKLKEDNSGKLQSRKSITKERRKSNSEKYYGPVSLVAFAGVSTLMYLHRSGVTGRTIDRGKELVTRNYKKAQAIKERYDGLSENQKKTYQQLVDNGAKVLSKPETQEQALRRTNPYYLTPLGKKNCVSCSLAYALRSKFGVNVTAQPGSPGSMGTNRAIKSFVKNYDTNVISRKYFGGVTFNEQYSFKKNAENAILHAFKDDGATGACWVQWNGIGSGHAFNWEIRNGRVKFKDAQIGVEGNVEKKRYFERANFTDDFGAVRLDNAELNVEELKKYVKFR